MSSVAELVNKHEAFQKTLEAQEEKISTLEQLAQALLAQDHYASREVRERCDGVLQRRDRLKQAAQARAKKLQDSHNYQQFLRNVYEVGLYVCVKIWHKVLLNFFSDFEDYVISSI